MKPCKCSGNNGLRMGLGAVCCPTCGGELSTLQAFSRIISRLNECDEMDSSLLSGLVALDMTECDRCGGWFKESQAIRAGDRCCCPHCFDWAHFAREDDDDETMDHVIPALLKRIHGTPFWDKLPREQYGKHKGKLSEPFLTYYKQFSNLAV